MNIAKKYQRRGLPLEDLISEGNIGLLRAIDRFDVEKGYHFISYAVWWIRQSILNAINEKSRTIRLPVNRAMELAQLENALEMGAQLAGEVGASPGGGARARSRWTPPSGPATMPRRSATPWKTRATSRRTTT